MPHSHAISLLTPPPPVVSPDTAVADIFALLQRPEVSCIMIAKDVEPIGAITQASFLRAFCNNSMKLDGLQLLDALLTMYPETEDEKKTISACISATQVRPSKKNGALTREDLLKWIQLSNELPRKNLVTLCHFATLVPVTMPPADALALMQQENSAYLVLQLNDQNYCAWSAKECLELCLDASATPRSSFSECNPSPTPTLDWQSSIPEAWARMLSTQTDSLVLTGAENGVLYVADKTDLTQSIHGPLLDTLQRVLVSEQKTEKKYQTMFLNAGLGFFLARMDGSLVSVNPALAKLMGYDSPDEMILSVDDIGKQLYVDSAKRLEVMHTLQTQGEIRNFEFEARKKDGSTLWLLVNASSNTTDRFQGVEGTVLDITDRKRNEEAQLTIQAAQKTNEAKSELLRNMSHEIRTPLNALIGMADLLWSTQLNDEQKKLLHIISNSGTFLLELINHILNMSKMEAGELDAQEVPFDLVDLVEDICEIMSVRVHEKKLELYSRIASDVPLHLVGDPTCLRQILINLVGNAMKFTHDGYISISCDLLPETEKAPEHQNTALLQFSVRDTGIGIPKEKLASIFGMFAQADSSITRRFGGTGLGLSISQKLVTMMGGRIWVESEPGEGSTFLFTVRAQLDQTPESKTIAEADIRGCSVLLLDNNERSRRQLINILQSWEVRVQEVDTGQACLECIHSLEEADANTFDAIIIDAQIPGREGYKTAFRVARNYGLSDRLIMVFTPNTGSDNLSWVKEIGAASYLFKPAKRKDLKRALLVAMKRLDKQLPQNDQLCDLSIPRVRVLCAEDNEYNRIIIHNYLQDTPVSLEFAEDGAIAVEKFLQNEYDLVLMDIQLPVMDGLSATRAIRDFERQEQRKPTPILALTAHALDEEKEKSRQAGCDAHLTKPLLRDTLLQAIRTHAGQDEQDPAPAPQPKPKFTPVIQSSGPVVVGNPRLKKHIPGYLDSCRDNLKKMRTGLEDADHELVERLGHSIKGSGAGFGFEPITRIGGTIEAATRVKDFSTVSAALDELEVYLDTVTVVFDELT